MNWSKEHLEARMLDAIEGRLSDDQLIQLQQLLEENPELGDVNDSMIFIHQDESIEFDHDSLLKKESFNPLAYITVEGSDKEKMSIARMEGILTIEEEKTFEHLLNVDQELIQQWELVQQTKLIPNQQILFPSIETLIKEKGKVIPFRLYFSYAAAASIIFLLFLNWPSQGSRAITASKAVQKPIKVEQKDTEQQNPQTDKALFKMPTLSASHYVYYVNQEQNEVRDCIVQEVLPHVDQMPVVIPSMQALTEIETTELAAVNSKSTQISAINVTKNHESIGIREFVIQKGNEKLFGTAKPSTAEKYTSITNYLAQSVNIPISYHENEDQEVKTTFFKLGFITVERKQTKK
jgi:hypothetical protein